MKKRQEIIDNYELGLSNLMIKNNIKLKAIYKKNTDLKTKKVIDKIKQRLSEIILKKPKYYKKNPTDYFWEDFYKKFGIVKIDLIKNNNKNLDIRNLLILLKKKGNYYSEAINN